MKAVFLAVLAILPVTIAPAGAESADVWKNSNKTLLQYIQEGYELKSAARYSPNESYADIFEQQYFLQKGNSLVACYEEMTLDKRSIDAKPNWSRSQCQELTAQTSAAVGTRFYAAEHAPPAKPTPEPRSPATGETKSEKEAREKAESAKGCKATGQC